MHSLSVVEPYTVVSMRSGEREVPPFVALGTTDAREAERRALAFANERYPGEAQIVVVGVEQRGNGQASRTRSI
jgi:hypothetical protein